MDITYFLEQISNSLSNLSIVSGSFLDFFRNGNGINIEPSLTDWMLVFATIGTAIGTISAVTVALFGKSFWNWTKRPILEIEFENNEPFCRYTGRSYNIRTRKVEDEDAYHVRLRIKNRGKTPAKGCKGRLVAIADEDLRKVLDDFDSVVLHWTGSDKYVFKNMGDVSGFDQYESWVININPREYDYLDLLAVSAKTVDFHGEMIDLSPRFIVQAVDRDRPRGFTCYRQRGNFFFFISIYSENAKPVEEVFRVEMGDRWDNVRLSLADRRERNEFRSLLK